MDPQGVCLGEDPLVGAVLQGVCFVSRGTTSGALVASQDGAGAVALAVLEIVAAVDSFWLAVVLAELALRGSRRWHGDPASDCGGWSCDHGIEADVP